MLGLASHACSAALIGVLCRGQRLSTAAASIALMAVAAKHTSALAKGRCLCCCCGVPVSGGCGWRLLRPGQTSEHAP